MTRAREGIFVRISSEGPDPLILLTGEATGLNQQPQRLTAAEGILLPLSQGSSGGSGRLGMGDGRRQAVAWMAKGFGLFSPAADWLGTNLPPWAPSWVNI